MIKHNIIIQLEKIRKQHCNKMNSYILNNVSFDIAHKEIVMITGKSGSGKTTLLEIIAGIQRHTHGTVKIYNTYYTNESMYYRNIILMDVDSTLFENTSIYDNIYFGFNCESNIDEEKKKSIIYEYANKFNIAHLLHLYPHNLSSGQKQLATICRSTLEKNKIVLMDEPFDKIDNTYKQIVYKHIQYCRDNNDLTFLIITHNISDINNLANKVILLTKNGVKVSSNIQEIKSYIATNNNATQKDNYIQLSYSYIPLQKIKIDKHNNIVYLHLNDTIYSVPYNICEYNKSCTNICIYISKAISIKEENNSTYKNYINKTTKNKVHSILEIIYKISYVSYNDNIYTYALKHNKLTIYITSIKQIEYNFVSIMSIMNKFLIFY